VTLSEHAQQLSTYDQVALLCMLTGAVVILTVLARGALVLLVGALWLIRAALIRTARAFLRIEQAHYRGIERVRRDEARHRSTVSV